MSDKRAMLTRLLSLAMLMAVVAPVITFGFSAVAPLPQPGQDTASVVSSSDGIALDVVPTAYTMGVDASMNMLVTSADVPAVTPVQPAAPADPDDCEVVKEGQLLSTMSATHGRPGQYAAVAQENGIADPNRIRVDQKICFHLRDPKPAPAAPAPAEQAAPDPGPSVAERALQFALDVDKAGRAHYKRGANGPDAYDCSGLVAAAFKHAGFDLGVRTSSAMSGLEGKHYIPVSRGDIRPGDLVFKYNPVSHVGIATDNDNMVSASTSKAKRADQIRVSSISRGFHSAIRVVA